MNFGFPHIPVHFPHRILLSAGLLLGVPATLPAQTTEWIYHKTDDSLHPDGNEQQLVWLMNRARANPTAEGLFLANSGDAGINGGISFFKVDTTLMQNEFAAITAKPPAAFDRRIYEGSRLHSLYMISEDDQTHDGQFERVSDAGFSLGTASASIFTKAKTAMDAHGALNIDWGFPDFNGDTDGMQAGRGHRVGIMSNQSTLLTNVGFAMVPDTNPDTDVGPFVFSGTYSSAPSTAPNHYNRFLVGTVWADANNNNRYDPGEGLNNVLVQPDRGPFHAITGVGGGWAIPITTSATYNLTLSGTAMAGTLTRSATVGADSVLVDVKTTAAATAMTIAFTLEADGNIRLTWTGGRAPYQVQQTSSLATAWTNLGATTSTTNAIVPRSGPRNFYRVVSGP